MSYRDKLDYLMATFESRLRSGENPSSAWTNSCHDYAEVYSDELTPFPSGEKIAAANAHGVLSRIENPSPTRRPSS